MRITNDLQTLIDRGEKFSTVYADPPSERINQEDPSLDAIVGYSQPGNKYLPVIVGEYLPLDEARAIKRKALALESIDDAYLSAYSD